MAHRQLPHILAYDIANPKRLGRVHRYLKKMGLPLQYSVFLLTLDAQRRDKVLKHLQTLIHPRQDYVRLYPLPDNPDWVKLGKQFWDDGVLLTGAKLPAQVRYNLDTL